RKDPLELARGLVPTPVGNEDPRQVGARAHPAVLGGALQVRAGGGRVALSKSEDPQELLRSAELLATGGDPPQMRRGLTRRLLGDIQLGKYDDVDIATWAQRMRMLERHDRQLRLTE